MCGRYSLTAPAEAVRDLFSYLERPNLMPRANIAPTQDVAAVRLGAEGARRFVRLRWGLIPSWAKDATVGSRMINARAETLAEKPSFRQAFRARRCLIAADGFYEWKSEGGVKQPYRVARADAAPFAFAGLWERWDGNPEGPALETCSIVTTEANARLREIHARMPVMLDPARFAAWLDPRTPLAEAQALLAPYPPDGLTVYRVSRRVNAVANDDLALLEPLEESGTPAATAVQPRLL